MIGHVREPAVSHLSALPTPPVAAAHGRAEQLPCAQCGGIGWVRVAEIDPDDGWRDRLAPCACQTARLARDRWERARKASDMTDRLLTLDFAGYDPRDNAEALALARMWAAQDETDADWLPWLFLYGGYGSGKTHLLAAAYNALMAAGKYPVYTLVPALLDHVRDALDSERPQDYGARFRAVQQAPILMLDDLGAEKRSAWTDETLFKLLDYRYRAELPTAIATNADPDELEPRIASRLQDVALCHVVLMAGADYRLKARSSRKGAR